MRLVIAGNPGLWLASERELDLNLLGQTESIFALSNGHIGLRGNLDEGEPSASPGTFLNNFYEVCQLPWRPAARHLDPRDRPWGAALMLSVIRSAAVSFSSGKCLALVLPYERSCQTRPTTAPRMTTTPMAIR
jgi:Glycosyl hydrolase family 65, N-terminal domain